MRSLLRLAQVVPFAVVVLLVACNQTPAGTADAGAGGSCTTTLTPSATGGMDYATVQAALIAARTGDTICFGAGTFRFDRELSLSVSGVTLRGASATPRPILDFMPQQGNAQGGANAIIIRDVRDIVVQDLDIRDSEGDAVRAQGVTNITFRNVFAHWTGTPRSPQNGAYALYPIQCTNVLIEDCEIVGASDAGLYVGQSRNIIVRRNEVHGNVAGIEIENCDNADVYENHAYDNSGGLLVFDLPGLVLKNGRYTRVHNNFIERNNGENFALTGIIRQVPVGTGVMLLASNDTEVDNNRIENNQSVGLIGLSYGTVEGLTGQMANDAMYDPWLERVYVHDNTYVGNSADPQGAVLIASAMASVDPPLGDILWDGLVNPAWDAATKTANRLCIGETTTYRRLNVATNFAPMPDDTDKSPHACTYPAQPPVVLGASRDGGT